jgi:hypothetical protein
VTAGFAAGSNFSPGQTSAWTASTLEAMWSASSAV